MINDLIQTNLIEILNVGVQIVLFVGGAVFSWVTARTLGPKWRMDAEASRQVVQEKLRDALHLAAVTGVTRAAEQGLTGIAAVRFAMIHIIKSVPESILKLTPTTEEILNSGPADVVLGKLPISVRDTIENIVVSKMDGSTDKEIGFDLVSDLQQKVAHTAEQAVRKAIDENLNFRR